MMSPKRKRSGALIAPFLEKIVSKNMLCREADLRTESSVEAHFFLPLVRDLLGYKSKDIRTKETIDALSVSSGRKRVLYRPDFAITRRGHVRWICDAKSTAEKIDSWRGQCKSYCHELNARYETGENPVAFYMLTNGLETKVYNWDSDRPLVVLAFSDFVEGNAKLAKLIKILGAGSETFLHSPEKQAPILLIGKKSANELNADFAWCHDQIHKKDALSYTAAFMEFVKLIFLKLLSDRELHSAFPTFSDPEAEVLQVLDPAKNVKFSSARLIAAEAAGVDNPIGVEFDHLREELELQIKQQNKKRIFPEGERLGLSKNVIRDIVKRLESTDLYGLDADLNGRLFETFLNATLRGKALGQYFTPRSVVKLAVAMAGLHVSPKIDACDVVIDACCGSGGFLIEALADLWRGVDKLKGISAADRTRLKESIAVKCLYGIDSAKDPALARIARMNMYLHGDGGSAIYQLDALDKDMKGDGLSTSEGKSELQDFAKVLNAHPNGFATVALTNPPFARDYERELRPSKKGYKPSVLDEYELAFDDSEAKKPKAKLKSSAMFLERYVDFLVPGGRLITVIDDSVLGSRGFEATRTWLRQKYIIEAVVSLPGDAFQRSEARVKTSILALRKRHDEPEVQGDVFMYYSQYVGVDDPSRERVLPIDEDNHRAAQDEIEHISRLLAAFMSGARTGEVAPWVVPDSALKDRWAVKACLLKPGRMVAKWKAAGLKVATLASLVDPVFVDGKLHAAQLGKVDEVLAARLIRPKITKSVRITHLRMTYRGMAERGEEKFSQDTDAATLFRVAAGDLVISHINALHGAIGIVPAELDGLVVTNEYTVLRVRDGIDARVLCEILRTEDLRADVILRSTGIGRTRATWKELQSLMVPLPRSGPANVLTKLHDKAERLASELRVLREKAATELFTECHLGDHEAKNILGSFKPPA